jgi:hypothetical protein
MAQQKRIKSAKGEMTLKINHAIRRPAVLRLVLSVIIATFVFTMAANAHPSFAGKFNLPFEVHWGEAVLPAGQYFIHMNPTTDPAVISSVTGDRTVFIRVLTTADSKISGTYLTITNEESEQKVRSLNVAGLGKVVIFAPLTTGEQEALAKSGGIKTIPILAAKK